MKLYYNPLSTYSQKVLIALYEKGIRQGQGGVRANLERAGPGCGCLIASARFGLQ